MKLPSDLLGVTAATYKSNAAKDWKLALGPACDQIRRQIGKLGRRARIDADTIATYQQVRSFCDRISGYWWERIKQDKTSALSYVSVKLDPSTAAIRMTGRAFDRNGAHVANWKTIASCVNCKEQKVFYWWEGWPPSRPAEPYEVVVRARRIQGGTGDNVVKLRPINPVNLPPEMRASQNVKVEVDVMPRGFVCSASMKGVASAAAIRSVTLGENPIKSLFSKEQRSLFRARAPEGLKLNDLAILGPINILKLVFEPKGLKRKFVAELWLYPDGSRLLELSTNCPPTKAFQVGTEVRSYLTEIGIDLTAEQQPKTNRALKYFSAQLKIAETASQATSAAAQPPSEQVAA